MGYVYLLGIGMKKQFRVKFFACIALSIAIFKVESARLYQESQDILIDNIVVHKELGDCQSRYEAIKPILDKYKRPITVLELGACQGYNTFRIAYEYPKSTCVMIEDNGKSMQRADRLMELCQLNSKLQNLVLLNTDITLKELNKLADCEHFDVVLAIDYINPEAANCKQVFDAILRLGDNIFIQTPWSENTSNKQLVEYMATQLGNLILQTPCAQNPKIQEQLFWFERNKTGLRCKCFAWESNDSFMDIFKIKSSYTEKALFKKGSTKGIPWKNGINLVTYLMLNGVYPTREHAKLSVAELTHEKLRDFAPWNIVVQGNKIILIDQGPRNSQVNLKNSLKYLNAVIDGRPGPGYSNLFKNVHKHHLTDSTWSWLSRLF